MSQSKYHAWPRHYNNICKCYKWNRPAYKECNIRYLELQIQLHVPCCTLPLSTNWTCNTTFSNVWLSIGFHQWASAISEYNYVFGQLLWWTVLPRHELISTKEEYFMLSRIFLLNFCRKIVFIQLTNLVEFLLKKKMKLTTERPWVHWSVAFSLAMMIFLPHVRNEY